MTTSPPRFWEHLQSPGDRAAIIDARTGRGISYRRLALAARLGGQRLATGPRSLVCICMRNDMEGILCYLSTLLSGNTVCLCGPDAAYSIDSEFVSHYAPDVVLWRGTADLPSLPGAVYRAARPLFGYRVAMRGESEGSLHPDLALLLRTSGSTGNAKVARLSYDNIAASATQVVAALRLGSDDRACLSLPLHHVYGLSVLHSVLAVGGVLLLNSRTVLEPAYWRDCHAHGVTVLPLVPMQLKLMSGLTEDLFERIRGVRITTSGAALDSATRRWLQRRALPQGIEIYSMYGTTESSGRIAVLPPESFALYPESVGQAVPGGSLEFLAHGEIVYRGPNVMMGLANARPGLECGDELGGRLSTGDLGYLDEHGNLYVTGRINRLCKVCGLRVHLGDIESELAHHAEVAAIGDDTLIRVFHTAADDTTLRAAASSLARRIGMPLSAMVISRVMEIPRTAGGKVRYAELERHGRQLERPRSPLP